jgi:membrane protease YdiL (CAAX protease family)
LDFGAVKAHLTSPTEETLQALKVELINLPNYIGAGVILSLAYYYNDSIVSSWMAHTLNNLWSMIGVAQLIMGGNE